MGCGSSRSVATVAPSRHGKTASKTATTSVRSGKDVQQRNSDGSVRIDKNSNNIIQVSPSQSLTNLNHTNEKPREISASSSRTADSGIDELEDQEILTENSSPNKLTRVEASERPNTPELILEGRACPRKQSSKEKRRLELEKKNSDSAIPKLPPLGDGGLVPRPKTRGGIAFDIKLCPETGNIKKAPANLPKLERRKKGRNLTKEELEEKMRKAAERRQEHKQKIIEKSQAFLALYGNVGHVRNQEESNMNNSDNADKRQEINHNTVESELDKRMDNSNQKSYES